MDASEVLKIHNLVTVFFNTKFKEDKENDAGKYIEAIQDKIFSPYTIFNRSLYTYIMSCNL